VPATAGQEGVIDRAQQVAETTGSEFLAQMKADPWTWVHLVAAVVVLGVLVAVGVLRTGTLKGGRDVSPHPWLIWLACGLLVLGTSWVGGGVVASLLGFGGIDPTDGGAGGGSALRQQAIASLAGWGLAVAAALVMRRILAMSAPKAGLEWRPDGWLKGGIAAILMWPVVQAAAIVTTWVVIRAGGDAPDRVAHSTLQTVLDARGDPWAWVLAGLAIVAAPIVEEFVFRVGLQSAVLGLFKRPWLAILVSSLTFAAIHMGDPKTAQWPAMAALWVLGVCLGFAYEKTRSFLIPIIMHAAFNGANVALALAGVAGE